MPKILWTKTGIETEVRAALPEFQHYFLDVIQTATLPTENFDLEDESLIFTSVNGVKGFFENGFSFPRQNNKVYCVGGRTEALLNEHHIQPVVELRNGEELGAWLTKNASEEKFLHFCGTLALDILKQNTDGQQISYRKVPVYETRLLYPEFSEDTDAIVFFSPSGARSLCENNNVTQEAKVFSIGDSTTQELVRQGLKRTVTSTACTLRDLISLVQRNFELKHD